MALGDPEAVAAYREAVPVTTGTEHRLVRARLARAACVRGRPRDRRARRWPGSTSRTTPPTRPILLARGQPRLLHRRRRRRLGRRRHRPRPAADTGRPVALVDLIGLQGLIAHQRGEWFERFRHGAAPHPGQAAAWPPPSSTRTSASRSTCSTAPCPYAEVMRARRGAAPARRPGRGAARRRLRHRADRRGGAADGRPGRAPSASCWRPSTCTATSTRRPVRRTACSGWPRCGWPAATGWRPSACCGRRCRWPGGRSSASTCCSGSTAR